MNTPRYRPCVGLALFNAQGLVFVGQRLDTPAAWQMPQGGIDPGETLEQAVFRELEEETGTSQAVLLRFAPHPVRYDLPDTLRRSLWQGEYVGQEQHWAALRFTGQDKDFNLNTHSPPEFSAWKWVRLEETERLIVPFKRETYKQVIGFFSGLPAQIATS